MEKRFYWLKLQGNFFQDIRIKKLRKLAGGDTYCLIYFKMLLMSLEQGGILSYPDTGDEFEVNVALDIDEDEENVKVLCAYLLRVGLMEILDDGSAYLPYVSENTGTETAAAERVRKMRARKERNNVTPMLRDCSETVTLEIEKDIDTDSSSSKLNLFAPSQDASEPEAPRSESAPKRKETKRKEPKEEAPVEALITNTGAVWRPDVETYQEYKRLYPNVDIDAQFRAMRGWCINNPTKRKTASGMSRFVGNWLAKEQNRNQTAAGQAVKKTSAGVAAQKPNGFHNFTERTYDYDKLQEIMRAKGG